MKSSRLPAAIVTVIVSTVALLGPVLSSPAMGEVGLFGMPRSYLYLLVIWVASIVATAWLVRPSPKRRP